MAKKYSHLLPSDSSAEAFDRWLAATGVDVPAEDLADLYADICLLAGWPLAAESAAPTMPAAIEPADTIPDVVGTVAIGAGQIKLSAPDAALRFRDWMFECGRDGTYTSAELSDEYLEHCRCEDLIPHADNELRPHLQKLGGVKKSSVTVNFKSNKGPERNRSVRWVFKTPKGFEKTIPWTELPDRRRAA